MAIVFSGAIPALAATSPGSYSGSPEAISQATIPSAESLLDSIRPKTFGNDNNKGFITNGSSSFQGEFYRLFGKVLAVLSVVAGILALIFLIYNGILFITSAGDSGKAKTAKANIIHIVTGIVVIVAAFFIIRLAQTIGNSIARVQPEASATPFPSPTFTPVATKSPTTSSSNPPSVTPQAGASPSSSNTTGATTPSPTTPSNNPDSTSTLALSSNGFGSNQPIPKNYTCEGADVSPPLTISDKPQGTKSLALIVHDPDAPNGDWLHWIVWGISPSAQNVAQGAVPLNGTQGKNDFGKFNWNGPCPPAGNAHRYVFDVFALDTTLTLPTSTTRQQLLSSMSGHILQQAKLTGTYQIK